MAKQKRYKRWNMVSHDGYLETRASQGGDASVEMTEEHWKVARRWTVAKVLQLFNLRDAQI